MKYIHFELKIITLCNSACLKFDESNWLCFAHDYHSKIHNCFLENSLKPGHVLPEITSVNLCKIITDPCSAIPFSYHILNIMPIPSWHRFKYWKTYTKQRNACTLDSSTSKFRMTLAKRSLNYFCILQPYLFCWKLFEVILYIIWLISFMEIPLISLLKNWSSYCVIVWVFS